MKKQRKKERNMTEGAILKHIVLFSLPLMVGSLFQQLYNTVDSIIVGRFVSKQALAAVGSVGPVINSLIGFFMGLSAGAGVVVSQYYGGKKEDKVCQAVQTTLCMTLAFGVIFTVIGVTLTPVLLRLMSTPEDVMHDAMCYLRIYFMGITGLMIYNMGSGILRAVGDSRRPLYFLIFSTCMNILLDFIFVVFMNMGIEGVALATVLSQGISAVLVLNTLSVSEGCYRIIWKHLRVDIVILQQIFRIGLPAAIQQTVTSFSNVFVQSYINEFGSSVMAGWSAYSKIDQFMLLPMTGVSLALTTFVGQNLGAGNVERVKNGTKTALHLSLGVTFAGMIPLLLFASSFVRIFNQDPEVVYYGALFIRLLSPFYFWGCVNQIYAATLSGAGDTKIPMFIMLGSYVLSRQIYLLWASGKYGTVISVAMGYPVGWLLCCIFLYMYYKTGHWEKHVKEIGNRDGK